MMRSYLLVVILAILASALGPAAAQNLDATRLYEQAAPSVAKIVVNGTAISGREETREGSGFVVYSGNRFTVVVTAAHVIGTDEEWHPAAGNLPTRTIKIQLLDEGTNTLRSPIEAWVHEQSDTQDWAILLIAGGKDRSLKRGRATEVGPGADVLLLGFKAGSSTADPDSGTAATAEPKGYGFALRLNDLDVLSGMSGGPVLNAKGEVVGIASRDLRDENGYHLAVPISLTTSSLSGIEADPGAIPLDEAVSPIQMSVNVFVQVSGNGGGALQGSPSAQGGLGQVVRVDAGGGESSECDAGSGRTVSRGVVDAKATPEGSNALAIDVQVLAQGGHYRTADACIKDPFSGDRKLIGIHGNDTGTNAGYQIQGTVAVPVDPILADKITVAWQDMPAGSRLTALNPAGAVVVDNVDLTGTSAIEIPVTVRGTIVLNPVVAKSYNHNGSCCAVQDRVAAKLTIDRHLP